MVKCRLEIGVVVVAFAGRIACPASKGRRRLAELKQMSKQSQAPGKERDKNEGASGMERKVAEDNFNNGSAAVVSEGLRVRRS